MIMNNGASPAHIETQTSVAEFVTRGQRTRSCFALTYQPIGAQLWSHVTDGAVAAIGMRLSDVFLQVEIATESSGADSADKRLDVTVRVHMKR